MIQAYADFMYQIGLVDELQRDFYASKAGDAVNFINQKKWVEAAEVSYCDVLLRFVLII